MMLVVLTTSAAAADAAAAINTGPSNPILENRSALKRYLAVLRACAAAKALREIRLVLSDLMAPLCNCLPRSRQVQKPELASAASTAVMSTGHQRSSSPRGTSGLVPVSWGKVRPQSSNSHEP